MNLRKVSHDSEWTKVPGWDDAKHVYVELDCERWIRENKIREAGQENGKQEFPPSEAVQPDEMYTKILAWVNNRGRACHAAVSDYLNLQRHALTLEAQEGTAPLRHQVEGIRNQGIVELRDQCREDKNHLAHLGHEAKVATGGLEKFKKTASLDRIAEYDQRGTWYWWLVGVIVIEALANAMMLADVNEYGLQGAVSVMIAIGVVNTCVLGSVIGEGWRQKNSVKTWPRTAGWAMVVIGTWMMFGWNLLVGHFRDSMRSVVTKAASGESTLTELMADDTIERFLVNPLGLEGMLSWVLAVIGVGCCIFSATKWLKRDDVYPGYGTVHRAATDRSIEYRHEVTARSSNLKSVYERYLARIRDLRQQTENKKSNHTLISDRANEIVRQFPMQLRRYQDDLEFIIAAYRSTNEKARTAPSPEFFEKNMAIDQEMLATPPWKDVPPTDYEEDWEQFHRAEVEVQREYLRSQKSYPTLSELMEKVDTDEGITK